MITSLVDMALNSGQYSNTTAEQWKRHLVCMNNVLKDEVNVIKARLDALEGE